MKRFLIHIILFAILFFIVDRAFCFFIQNAPKKEYDKRLQYIIDGEMNKDIIILGSSRGANNVVAKQIEDSTGFSTYNLSYRGSDVSFHKFLLESVLKFNKQPKKVMLVLDSGYEFNDVPTLNFRFDRLYPLKNYSYINNKLIEDKKQNRLSKMFCLARIKQKDFNLKANKVLPINVMTSHGSKINSQKGDATLVYGNGYKPYEIDKENLSKINDLEAIQNICKENEIELIFVFPPNFKSFDGSFYERFSSLIKKENRIMIYDTMDVRYTDSKYFRDESHLNKKGAEIFTNEMIQFINSK